MKPAPVQKILPQLRLVCKYKFGGTEIHAVGISFQKWNNSANLRSKRTGAWRVRNHKPKQWTKGEVQMLIKMVNVGSTAGEIATELGRYIASVKRVARDMGFLLRSERSAAQRRRRISRL
ncbi:hypothetical protein ACVIN2_002496 [Bradyrhizobium sp. USDA 3650]